METLSQSMFLYQMDNILDKGYSVSLDAIEKITLNRTMKAYVVNKENTKQNKAFVVSLRWVIITYNSA